MVELQNMVQNMTHTEAEIQQMSNLLQDLESSMNNTKQRQEEVRTDRPYNKYFKFTYTCKEHVYCCILELQCQAKGGLQLGVVKDSAR